jgi:N-acetylneuraminic acid mutarotase
VFSGEGPPYPQEGSSISYFNGSLYLFGYSLIQTLENDYVKNDIYRYDLDGNYWEVVEVKGDRPDGRVYHYSCIYNNELYIFFGLDYATFSEFKNFYKFNFEKSEWILVESDFGISNSQGAFVQVDNIVHFIHGRNLFEITNSIITLDLSKDNLGRNITSPYWISPSERIDHCGLVIGTNFYVFGGVMLRENDIKSYQNDIWAFDLEMKIWNPVNFFGDIPSQRASFACSKTNSETFAIFGGVSESGILDDLFIFHEPQRTWYRLNAENDFPSKRQSACIVFQGVRVLGC